METAEPKLRVHCIYYPNVWTIADHQAERVALIGTYWTAEDAETAMRRLLGNPSELESARLGRIS